MKNNARQIVLHLSPWLLLALGACGGGGDTLQTVSPIAEGEQLPAGMPVIGGQFPADSAPRHRRQPLRYAREPGNG